MSYAPDPGRQVLLYTLATALILTAIFAALLIGRAGGNP